jgi:hypothetical protein
MRIVGDIDPAKTEEVKVQSKPSGLWWIVTGREKQDQDGEDERRTPTEKKRKNSSASEVRNGDTSTKDRNVQDKDTQPPRAKPVRRFTWDRSSSRHESDNLSVTSVNTKDDTHSVGNGMTGWLSRSLTSPSLMSDIAALESSEKTKASKSIVKAESLSKSANAAPTHSQTPVEGESFNFVYVSNSHPSLVTTTVQQAPLWMINACNALEFLTVEHPKAMTAVSAILVTVGSLPAIPAISAGAGGAILASHAAQAVGAIAVGVGHWLKNTQDATAARQHPQNPQTGSIASI